MASEKMILQTLVIAIGVSGLTHIITDFFEKWVLTYIFKPLTMLLIIGLVVLFADLNSLYTQLIIIGLSLSTLGDICLMLRPQKFIAGLASFLFAHIVYVIAFASQLENWSLPLVSYWPVPFAIGYFVYLSTKLASLKIPVFLYFGAISLMLITASGLYLQEASPANTYLLSGAILFAISDSILGYRKFVEPFKFGQVWIMLTYFSAQCLIALSTF